VKAEIRISNRGEMWRGRLTRGRGSVPLPEWQP